MNNVRYSPNEIILLNYFDLGDIINIESISPYMAYNTMIVLAFSSGENNRYTRALRSGYNAFGKTPFRMTPEFEKLIDPELHFFHV